MKINKKFLYYINIICAWIYIIHLLIMVAFPTIKHTDFYLFITTMVTAIYFFKIANEIKKM